MGYIIGIDPGTHCGWAVLNAAGERIASGVWDLANKRHEGGGMRYVRARRFLAELLSTFDVQALAYEEVRRHRGVSAAHVYGGVVAMLAVVCEEAGVPYMAIPVGTVKKTATGKGNASKGEMIAAAGRRWTPAEPFTSDDECDALWIAETWRLQEMPKPLIGHGRT